MVRRAFEIVRRTFEVIWCVIAAIADMVSVEMMTNLSLLKWVSRYSDTRWRQAITPNITTEIFLNYFCSECKRSVFMLKKKKKLTIIDIQNCHKLSLLYDLWFLYIFIASIASVFMLKKTNITYEKDTYSNTSMHRRSGYNSSPRKSI